MFYFNGELYQHNEITLNVNDPSFLYGATIFTTLRVYHHSLYHPLTNWENHLKRLKDSLTELEWIAPNWTRIKSEVEEILQYYPIIRITILPDGKELILGRNLPDNLTLKQTQGVKGFVFFDSQLKRSLPSHKTGNYLSCWLALEKTKKKGYDEAILTNFLGNWLETSTGNLWGYKDGVWFTPRLCEEILPGIVRQNIINNANFPLELNDWNNDFASSLEAIAYSNCAIEIIPFNLIKIEDKICHYNPQHPAYLLLKKCLYSVINN